MNCKEARELIGIGETASLDEIRRAYLKKVKQHNPEVDPDGFARVRAAFEQLKLERDLAERYGLETTVAPAEQDTPAPVPAPAVPLTSPAAPPAPEVPGPAPPSDHAEFEAMVAKFERIGFFDQDAKCAFLLAAWDKPSLRLLHFTLDKLLPIPAAREGLCRCLRKAVDGGITRALFVLGRISPQSITDTEVAHLLDSDDVQDRLFAAFLLIARGEDAGVMKVVQTTLDEMLEFPVGQILDLGLYALERNRLPLAVSLRDALAGRFQKYQDEAKLLGREETIQWAVLRELSRLGDWLWTGYVKDLAALFRGDATVSPQYLAARLLGSQGSPKVEQTRARLQREAPTVSQLLDLEHAGMLVDAERAPFELPLKSMAGGGLLVVFLLVKLIQCGTKSNHPTLSPAQQAALVQATHEAIARPYPPPELLAKTAGMARENLREVMEWTCGRRQAPSAGLPEAWTSEQERKQECERMQAILRERDQAECDGTDENWLRQDGDTPAMAQFLMYGRLLYGLQCGGAKKGQ